MNRIWSFEDYTHKLSHPNEFVRRWAFDAIEKFYPRRFAKKVSTLIGDSVEHLACAAPRYLGKHNATEFAPAILECFKNSSGAVAGNCIEALKAMQHKGAYNAVLEKLPHVESLDELLGIFGYLGIVDTEESLEILRQAFHEYKAEYFIGSIAQSLLAHQKTTDIELIIEQILDEAQDGMASDSICKGLVEATAASELFRMMDEDHNTDIFKSPKKVLDELNQFSPFITEQSRLLENLAVQIEQKQYDILVASLVFEVQSIVQKRYQEVPAYLNEIYDMDNMALNILVTVNKNHRFSKVVKLEGKIGATLLALVIAVAFSVIGRQNCIKALNPESTTDELIQCLKNTGQWLPDPIKNRLIAERPIDALVSSLTEDYGTWGDIWIVRLMGEIGDPAFIPILIKVVNEADFLDFIFGDACNALQCIDESGHDRLLTEMQNGVITDSIVGLDLLRALPYSESFDLAKRTWEKGYEEDSADSYEMYAVTLAGIGDERGIEALRDIIFKENAAFVGDSLETLCQLHDRQIPELSMIRNQRNARKRRLAARRNRLNDLLDEANAQEMVPPPTYENSVVPFRRDEPKIGRNAPCPCGSGKKYKKCCLNKS